MIYRQFWEAGFRVFPLNSARKNADGDWVCDCGNPHCAAPFKHPRASNWQHTPLWSDDQMDAIEEAGHFESGYGVLCRGLLVVDVDARNGGVDSYARLLDAVPDVAGAGLIVATGSGGGSRHLYFSLPDGGKSFLTHMPEYPGLDFKSSGFVVGPGSRHASGMRYGIGHGSVDDIEPAPEALLQMLVRPDRHRATVDGRSVDVSHADIRDMLAHVDPDADYDVWIKIGMSVHHSTGGTGFDVWDEWSAQGSKYNAESMERHWHSFGRCANPVTLGTLVHHAEAGGWRWPVSIGGEELALAQADLAEAPRDGLPFDISGVDLKSPPGFVGDLARWVEAQSRRPRESLAVAAALVGMGNVAGLRYTDDRDGVTCNLFAFCVAASRTGKEAIQQAQAEIHRAAGIAGATHGAIKSEQEITRNLTRHQAAFYIIDEIGIFLRKIKNAQDKGGALYLDGVIGMLMAAYSKATGYMLLTGDAKEDLRAQLGRELAQLKKRSEENEARPLDEARIAGVEKTLANLDKGLDRPFLSLVGYTTPVTFDELVDYQSATNGFIGRALIFNERDSAPRSKRGFRKEPMSAAMAATLLSIYTGDSFDATASERVEHYGDRLQVATSDGAHDMLDAALDWFEDQAIAHKGRTGLEALYLGAYELVSKVSLILAVPEGLRTAEHVRWAFALIRKDVEDKARMVIANDRAKDAPQQALAARIANIIDGDGETIGVIRNRLRKNRKEDVDKALASMVAAGVALMEDRVNPGNGRKTQHYRLAPDTIH